MKTVRYREQCGTSFQECSHGLMDIHYDRDQGHSTNTKQVPALMIPSADEDRLITAAALSDPDALPMTDAQLRELRPARPLPR